MAKLFEESFVTLVFDLNGVKEADQGGGSNFAAVGTATPRNNGVWAYE